jgi:predicted dehydrogenase
VLQDLDLALWLMGTAPTLVYALERGQGSAGDGPGHGGLTQVHLGFPGGGMAVIDNADLLPPGDGYQSLSVIASSGATYADDHQNVQLVYRGGHPSALRTEESGGQLLALVQSFVLALKAEAAGDDLRDDLTASVSSWRDVVTVAHAARRSIASQEAIPLAIERPLAPLAPLAPVETK